MKTHSTWGYDIVVPLVGAGTLICYALYQVGVPILLAYTLPIAAVFVIAYKYDQ